MNQKPLQLIGRAEPIDFPKFGINAVPSRIDTGARTSAIWATDITEHEGVLRFVLFGKGSKFYTGELINTAEFKQRVVTNSTGYNENRYVVKLSIVVAGRRIRASFTLADRSNQVYPVLIGRNVLRGKYIVDVKQGNPDRTAERHRDLKWKAKEVK